MEGSEAKVAAARAYQPIVLICAACIGGIACDRIWSPHPLAWLVAAVSSVVYWLSVSTTEFRGTAIILCAWFSTAALYHHGCWNLFASDDVGLSAAELPQPICVEAVALAPPRFRPAALADSLCTIPQSDKWEILLSVARVRDGRKWRIASGRAWLTVAGKEGLATFDVQTGNRLRICAVLTAPREPLNPGEDSAANYYRAERQLCRLSSDCAECVLVVDRATRWRLSSWTRTIRDQCDSWLWQYVQQPRAALASAVLLGTREQIDAERNEDFLTTGTIHLLSISGMHVGILAYAFWLTARIGLLHRRSTLCGAIAFVVWYALLTDAQPPVVRASVLVTVMCLARIVGRQSLGFNTLAVAALIVLAINPSALFHSGPQLSFLAVATMACLPRAGSAPVQDPLQRLVSNARPWPVRTAKAIGRLVFQAVALSAVIWFVSVPLVMYRFHVFSPIAAVLNPIVCLPMSAALFAGVGVIIFGGIVPPVAVVCGRVCDLSLAAMEWTIELGLCIPGNHVWGPSPPIWLIVVFYSACTVAVAVPQLLPVRRWFWALLALWLATASWMTFGPGARWRMADSQLMCTFIAVGHGTSVLIELPDGCTLLYDAGRLGTPISGGRPIAAALWSRGITHLDALIISHADSDHFNAVPYLLERFSVGTIYVSPQMFAGSQPAVVALREAIDERRILVQELAASDYLLISSGAAVRVLHPPLDAEPGSDNANSVVLAIEYAGCRLILPGDLESPGLERLLRLPPLDSDVLMAPHHGSARSDPSGFASWSIPETVIISGALVRDSRLVRRAYEAAGARVFHTAFQGAVQVTISRGNVDVQTFNP